QRGAKQRGQREDPLGHQVWFVWLGGCRPLRPAGVASVRYAAVSGAPGGDSGGGGASRQPAWTSCWLSATQLAPSAEPPGPAESPGLPSVAHACPPAAQLLPRASGPPYRESGGAPAPA